MNSWHLRLTNRELQRGGVVAYPTEAVWGLGCDPLNGDAVYRLLKLKRRRAEMGLILIASELEQLDGYVQLPSGERAERLKTSWPGFITWLLPVADGVPTWLTGRHEKLAARVTAHPVAAALCRTFGGPLVSTSANPSGLPPARSRLTVQRYFGNSVDYILSGPLGGERRPSKICDLMTESPARE